MPELPEVEVTCRGLRPHLIGQEIKGVSCSDKELRQPLPRTALRRLVGRRFDSITRRAKYLLIRLDDRGLLVIHLGMSGRLGLFAQATPRHGHDHVCWQLSSGLELRYNDARRFGSVQYFAPAEPENQSPLPRCGPEPLAEDCSAKLLHDQARKRRIAVKSLLMDGRFLAGVGNIYANEALFAARIHPATPANVLDLAHWQDLLGALRRILTQAIACGGSSISDYLDASGQPGYFQVNFQVYGRTKQPCPICATPIQKLTLANRASFLCPRCQPC